MQQILESRLAEATTRHKTSKQKLNISPQKAVSTCYLLPWPFAIESKDKDSVYEEKADMKELSAFYPPFSSSNDSLAAKTEGNAAAKLQIDTLAGPNLIPSPACLAVPRQAKFMWASIG